MAKMLHQADESFSEAQSHQDASAFQLKLLLLALVGIPGPLLFTATFLWFPPVSWLSENLAILLFQFVLVATPLVIFCIWLARRVSLKVVTVVCMAGLLLGSYPSWLIYKSLSRPPWKPTPNR